jgi:putative ABC transport system permease protein
MASFFANLFQDARYAVRNLARSPGFVIIALLTLALGIGANATIFGVLHNTLLKPLAFPDPDRLMLVFETFGKGPDNWNIVSAPNFWDFQRASRSFENMAIFDSAGRGYNLGGRQQAEQVSGLRVTSGYFPILGVKPLLGRTFLPEEETLGRDREVVLSYGLWKNRYGGDPMLVGKSIPIDGANFEVVGVMPATFGWQFEGSPRQLWVPVGYTKTDFGRGNNSFLCIGRLKAGVTQAQANAEMEAIANHVRSQFPADDANMGGVVTPLADYGLEGLRTTLLALSAAVAFVLLIACVNVANLLLARGAARQKELAIRRALGAAGWRIAIQLLTESMMLALAGGLCGLIVAFWGSRALLYLFKLNGMDLPLRPVDSIPLDGPVLIFAFAVACVTGLLFGVAPALSAVRGNVNEPLKEGGRTGSSGGSSRLRNVLVASEVALALVVLCGAGLMIKSMTRLLGVDPGFRPGNLLTMGMSVPQEEIYVGPPDLPRFCSDVQEHVSAIPGVVSVSAAAHLPFLGNAGRGFQIEGRPPADPGNMPGANYSVACPGYFRTLGVPLRKGREFSQQDTKTAPGAIVINEAMAHEYWPKEDPIGRSIRLGGSDGPRLTVVGVVGDVHHQGLDVPMPRQFFRPYMQAGWPTMTVVVRTISSPAAYTAAVKKALAEALPDRPVSTAITMEEVIHDSTGSRRFPMLLLSVFSALALLLAAVGIVGVVGNAVTQRTHEIGIRMALGARTLDVIRLMVNSSMLWVLIGLAAGLAGAAGLTRLLGGMLYQVRPMDPGVLGGVALLLGGVAVAASYLPARRAAKIDPVIALRCE